MFLAQQDGGAHHGVTELRDAPAARAGDLGEETAEMQAFEEAGDVGAPAAIGASVGPKEVDPQVAVAEALQGVFAAEDGRKEGEVGGRRGIERTRRTALAIAHGLDEAVEGAVGRGGIVDDGEGIEVTVIGRCGHGGVAREIRDALRQGVPPESPSAAATRPATDFELIGVVDDGLDSQDTAVLVVHVDPVSLQGDGLSRPLVRRYWPELETGEESVVPSLALPPRLDNA